MRDEYRPSVRVEFLRDLDGFRKGEQTRSPWITARPLVEAGVVKVIGDDRKRASKETSAASDADQSA